MSGLVRSPVDIGGYPHGTQSSLAERILEYWDENLETALENKFYLPFTLNPPELELLNKIVAPLVCCNPNPTRKFVKEDKTETERKLDQWYGEEKQPDNFNPTKTFKDNFSLPVAAIRHPEHAVARALATVGDYFLRRKVQRIESAAFCEIGTAPAQIPNIKHHSCSVIAGRDVARIGAAIANHPDCTALRLALSGSSTPEWCIDGVEKCTQRHLVAIASDSIYDITPAQLAKAMDQKGTQVTYATLWCPPQLQCPDGDYENDIYHLRMSKGRATFDFKDSAFAYEHDIETWRAWAFGCSYSDQWTTLVNGTTGIVWETIQSWGPFKMIQITKVHGKCDVQRPIARDSTLVGVPDFTYVIDTIVNSKMRHWTHGLRSFRKAKRLRIIARAVADAPRIWIPRELFSEMLQFVYNRKDTDVDRPVIGSALSAKTRRLEVDAFVLQAGLKLGGVEHRNLVLSIMLIGTAGRMVQTQCISKVLSLFKHGPSTEGFFISLWHTMFGEENNLFNNLAGLSAVARIMSGDGPLTDFIANCVDEGYVRDHSRGTSITKTSGKLMETFTGRGGYGRILTCGCVGLGENWSAGKKWCVHGVPYATEHTEKVRVAKVDIEENYRYHSNLDKSASVLRIFEEFSEGKILNSCAAPGNDGNIGFNRSNYSSQYMTRTQPQGKWTLDGNVHCEKCQIGMGYNCRNQYLDYGSSCESDYFHPERLSAKWRASNKYIVKVQKGLEMLNKGEFPKQFVGHYIAPVKCNGAEMCVANFRGDESWQQIVALLPSYEMTTETDFRKIDEPKQVETAAQVNWDEENPTMKNGKKGVDASEQTAEEEKEEPPPTYREWATSTDSDTGFMDGGEEKAVVESENDIEFGFCINEELLNTIDGNGYQEGKQVKPLEVRSEKNIVGAAFDFQFGYDVNESLIGTESIGVGTAPEDVIVEDVVAEIHTVVNDSRRSSTCSNYRIVDGKEVPVVAHVEAMEPECSHKFPEQTGCKECLPAFERSVYVGKFGKFWYNPNTMTECFASALLNREATRHDIPLLICIQSAQEDSKLEAYKDMNRYDFLSEHILSLLAAAMDYRIIIEYVERNEVIAYGSGFPRYLRLENEHFTSYHNPCGECALNEAFMCTDNHDVQWEKIHIPAFEVTQRERRLIRKELVSDKRFEKFHRPIMDHLQAQNPAFDMEIIVGKAGSGKTYTAMQKLKGEKDLLVIVPTRELQYEYETKYKRDGMKVQVWSQFCRDPTMSDSILIDELYMQHPLVTTIASQHCNKLRAIGDPEQNDYGGKGTSRVIQHITKYINTGTVQINCSRSVPLDVCRMLRGLGIRIKTHSKITRSINPMIRTKPRNPENGMCFMNKEEVQGEYKTVNKMQGARFENGTLYLDQGFTAAAQLKPPRSVYVGMTRHTKHLDVICRNKLAFALFETHHSCEQGGRVMSAVEGSTEFEHTSIAYGEGFASRKREHIVTEEIEGEQVRRLGTKFDVDQTVKELQCTVPENFGISNFVFGQHILPSTQPFDETNGYDEQEAKDELIHSYVGHYGSTFADAEEVLEKLSPTNSLVYQAERDLEFDYLGRNFSGKKLKLTLPEVVNKSKSEQLVTAARVRGRACKSSDYSQTVQTVLSRYSKMVRLAKGREAREAGDKLFEGLLKVLPFGVLKISMEEFANAQAAQVDRISAKKEKQEGIFGDGYENMEKILFFLKGQIKSDLKPNSWLRGADDGYTFNLKGGQGVSAQSKAINHIVGAWVTAAERKIAEALDPRVSLGYGRSPGKLRRRLQRLMERNKRADEVLCCDISEQDTSKGPWTNWFMRRVYRVCGVPEDIIDLIECANIHWRIDGVGVKLAVKHKFQSGRADTLFANTMMNLGLIFSSVEVTDLKFALFQGDDSYIRASKVRVVDENPILKIDRGQYGDFIGFLIGEDDIYLDLPRFAVKLMNRTFGDDQEINEYRVAVYDWLRVFQDADQLYRGLQMNANRYHTTEQDMAVLFSFLREFYLGNHFEVFRSKYSKANPNCVLTATMPIKIGISQRKAGPLSTMGDVIYN